jgi:hypothetical protein
VKLKLAGAGSALGIVLDVLLTGGDLLLSLSDLLFPMVSIVYSTLATEIPWLDQQTAYHALLFVAVLYLTNLALKLRDRLKSES